MQKRDAYTTDLAQFHDLIDQMDNHVNMLRQKRSDRQSSLKDNTSKLSTVNTKIIDLKNSIRSQQLSFETAKNLQSQTKCLAEAVDRCQSLNTKKRSLATQKTVDATGFWNRAQELTQNFDTLQKGLVYLLPTSDIPIPRFAVVRKNITVDDHSLSNDLESATEKKIVALKEKITSSTATAKNCFQETLDALDRCEGVLTEANENLSILKEKRSSREEILENERHLNCTKCSIRLMEAEALESKVLALREPAILEGRMSQLETHSTELKSRRNRTRRDDGQLIKGILAEIEEASSAIHDFDTFFSEKVQVGDQYRSTICSLEKELDQLSRRV